MTLIVTFGRRAGNVLVYSLLVMYLRIISHATTTAADYYTVQCKYSEALKMVRRCPIVRAEL